MTNKATITHWRNYRVVIFRDNFDYEVEPLGGLTTSVVKVNGEYRMGVATCHPKENYNKKTGRLLATERANGTDYITLCVPYDDVSKRPADPDTIWGRKLIIGAVREYLNNSRIIDDYSDIIFK